MNIVTNKSFCDKNYQHFCLILYLSKTYPTIHSPKPISQAMDPGFEVVRVTTVALQVEQVTLN